MLSIFPATTPQHLDIARTFFREYQRSIDTDLCFQSFEEELAGLPGKYAPPRGSLLIAWMQAPDGTESPVGVIAMRPLAGDICEMKRLYVRPAGRGHQLGRRLIEHLITTARTAGYRKMRLDTLTDKMSHAISLYREIGFYDIPPYFESPLPNELFLELDLQEVQGARCKAQG